MGNGEAFGLRHFLSIAAAFAEIVVVETVRNQMDRSPCHCLKVLLYQWRDADDGIALIENALLEFVMQLFGPMAKV